MLKSELEKLVQQIVSDAQALSAKHTNQGQAPVNYACIFTQSQNEFDILLDLISQFGEVVQKTDMGPVFKIPPLKTICGDLELLKIRKPDSERPERGDADFTIESYIDFKKECLSQQGFSLLTRSNMEMIELKDPSFNVLAYYSHPILKEVLNFK